MASPSAVANASLNSAEAQLAPVARDDTAGCTDVSQEGGTTKSVADVNDAARRHKAARSYALGLLGNTENSKDEPLPPATVQDMITTDKEAIEKVAVDEVVTDKEVNEKVAVVGIQALANEAARHEAARKYALSSTTRKKKKAPKLPATTASPMRGKRGRPKGSKDGDGQSNPLSPKAKRGRPKGSRDTKPRKKVTPQEKVLVLEMPKKDAKALRKARQKLELSVVRHEESKKTLEKAKKTLANAQKKLQQAEQSVEVEGDAVLRMIDEVADDLLLEPTRWNKYYRRLKAFKEREGHVKITKTELKKSSKPDHTDEQWKEYVEDYKTLKWWLSKQRSAKRASTLEKYQEILLDRLGVDWTPPQGPDSTKWFAKYEQCKNYINEFGSSKVPMSYDKQLSHWTKSQRSQYRNAATGKAPFLSEERIQLLNDIGFDWGEVPIRVSWEERFQELVKYRQEHGHAHVPWRWTENRGLAHWVNGQRNKYVDKRNGKASTLTEEQIAKLEGIGFAWSTGGTGKYDRDVEEIDSEEKFAV